MRVRALFAEHFRNLSELQLCPHPKFNVLFGDNGQGKTNVLEAIYLLSTLRSFRTARPGSIEELIELGQKSAQLRARVECNQVEQILTVQLQTGPLRKVAQLDGKTARGSEYFGAVSAILFAPDDLRLPKGPPAQRRRFLDRAVWNTCPAYLKEVQTYEKVLRNRNALLRREGRVGGATLQDLLPVYDEQLATAGAVLLCRRRFYLESIAGELAVAFDRVSRSGLEVAIRYRATVALDDGDTSATEDKKHAVADLLRERLLRDRRRDEMRGFTHSGPHADDLLFQLQGQAAAQFASQGQLRALILALKIAEIQHLRSVIGDSPVLLLDDVSSELDAHRNEYLFEFIREIPCQAFITTTHPRHVLIKEDRRDFPVTAGLVGPPQDVV